MKWNGWAFVHQLSGCVFESTWLSDIAPVSSKDSGQTGIYKLNIHSKRVCGKINTQLIYVNCKQAISV